MKKDIYIFLSLKTESKTLSTIEGRKMAVSIVYEQKKNLKIRDKK